jgi:hypothetical protein
MPLQLPTQQLVCLRIQTAAAAYPCFGDEGQGTTVLQEGNRGHDEPVDLRDASRCRTKDAIVGSATNWSVSTALGVSVSV